MLIARDAAADARHPSTVKQIRSLAIILLEEFGVPFRFYETATGAPLAGLTPDAEKSGLAPAPALEGPMAIRLVAEGVARVQPLGGSRYQLALPFPDADGLPTVAVGVIAALARTQAEVIQEQARLGKWLHSVHHRLVAASQSTVPHRHRPSSDTDGAGLVGLDALMGLEQLLRTQRIDKEPGHNRRQLLQTAAAVLKARTILWVPSEGEEALIEGERLLSPWDCRQLARLFIQDPGGAKAGYLINNRVQANSWGARYPQIVNLLAVPVPVKSAQIWVIALNKANTAARASHSNPARAGAKASGTGEGSSGSSVAGVARFHRTDAALLLPFAALLSVHLRASRRHQQFKELLVGLTRALAAAIDARDAFVTGHSERVARIAVELARELGLREDELTDVYLSGLLHDVGKIGVCDSLLRKREPLTTEEFAHIRQHVTIGSRFLARLQPIAHLLPAVLHHHERYDGTGYPAGLKGESIPFLARILAVAESYDAMTSLGPERAETAPEHVEEILSQGADVQWDGRVIAAFFRCRERILAVTERGFGGSLREALDTALSEPQRLGVDLG